MTTSERITIEDGSSWPNPHFNLKHEMAWKLRHGHELSSYDKKVVAGIVDAYNDLVRRTEFNKKTVMIRKALKAAPNE
jgi:hypothetical protein